MPPCKCFPGPWNAGPRATFSCCSFHSLFAALSSNVFLVASESDVRHCLPANASQGRGMLGPEPLSLVAACWAESHFLQLVPKALPKALASNASQGPGTKCFPGPWNAGPRAHFLLLQLAGPRATFYSLFPGHFPRPWLQMLPKALEMGPEPSFVFKMFF